MTKDKKYRWEWLILLDWGILLIEVAQVGKDLSSLGFAKLIDNFAVNGISNLTFIIGGAGGLSPKIIKKAKIVISLSKMTLPHILVRIFLIEQIYRAQSINANHPYHRY